MFNIKGTIIFILILYFLLSKEVKADTLDYWHIYYNDIKVELVSVDNPQYEFEYQIKSNEVTISDTLTFKYFTNHPCIDCKSHLVIRDEKNWKLFIPFSKEKSVTEYKFSLIELIKRANQNKSKYLKLEYDRNKEGLRYLIKIIII